VLRDEKSLYTLYTCARGCLRCRNNPLGAVTGADTAFRLPRSTKSAQLQRKDSTSRQRRPPMEAEHSMYYYSPSAGNELSDEPSLDPHPYTQQSRSSTAFILHPTPKRFKSTSQECRGERGRYRNSIPRLPRRRIRRKEDKTPFYAKPFRCRETKRKYWKSQGKEDTATISWQRGSSTAHRNQPR
jgi:hypothetical protein